MRQLVAALLVLGILSPLPASAFNATSTSFYLRGDLLSAGGGNATSSFSTSTSFSAVSAAAGTAYGTSTSNSSFTLIGGAIANLFKSVKPVYTLENYHWRLDNGSETTATAAVAENTATTSVQETVTQRLRIALSNEGGTEASYATQQPRLEYGLKVSTCSAIVSWTDVAAVAGDWDMSNTANLTNGGDTTNIATGIGGVTDTNRTFITDNNAILDTASAPSALLIPSDSFMELEYSIQALSAATDGGTYCFRVTNAGTATLYSYTRYPEATIAGGNSLPVASAVSIDSGASSVTLIENTTKNVVCSGTVTDNDGYANISAVGGFLYRTSVGTTSASDDNNRYRLYGDSQCVPSGGSGLSETYTCTFSVQYYADPTDAGSPNSSDTWTCEMHPRDATATGTPAVDTTEIASLMALDVTSTIAYGSVNANADTGSTNQSTTVENTGNRDMDPEVSGTSMTGTGTIVSSQQKYLASAFTYSGGGTALSGTPTQVNLDLPQRTGAGRNAPTFVQEVETTAWNAIGSATTGSFDVLAGDVLVAVGAAENENGIHNTPVGGSLTWTQQEIIDGLDFTEVAIWTATVDSNKSMTVQFSLTDGNVRHGGSVYTFRSSDGVGASNSATGADQAPSVNLTTTEDNSAVVAIVSDWEANDGATRSWRTNFGALTERVYDYSAGVYTSYSGYHADAGTAGTNAVGMTLPSSQDFSIAAVEVLGTGSGGGEIIDTLLWGLGVPNGTPNGIYTGTNTFTAAAGI